MMNGMFGGGMWFGWIFWIVMIAIIVWAVTLFTNKSRSENSNNFVEKETPLSILKKRYAKGEITKEQFDEMKKDLM